MTISSETTPSNKPAQAPITGRLRLSVEVFVWRQGWLWPLTAFVLMLVVALWMLQVRPMSMLLATTDRRIGTLEAGAKEAKQKQATDNLQQSPGSKTIGRTLATALPISTQADADVRDLYSLALDNGMTIQHADFTTTDDPLIGITRVQMIAPVTTTYPQLRQFLETLLRKSPHSTVDQLTFQRDDVSQHEIRAKFRVSWWFRTSKTIEPGDVESRADGNRS